MPALIRKLALAALMLAPAPALAATPEQELHCTSLGILAETVMRGRQAGVPMSAMLQQIEGSDETVAATRALILEAYSTPRYSSQAMQLRAAQEHRVWAEVTCFNAIYDR